MILKVEPQRFPVRERGARNLGKGRTKMNRIVIMGVSGCGKTSVGAALAGRLGLTFVDGDDLHPARNIVKMRAGRPLSDTDRWPWLDAVGTALQNDGVVGCSALKRAYRDWLRKRAGADLTFVHLHAEFAVLLRRVQSREGHFMPAALLQNQYDILEDLAPDERGFLIGIDQPLDAVIADAAAHLESMQA